MDDSLSFDGFLDGSRRFAHLAMDAHGRRDHDLFALHGGVAIERLAKAALVAKSPILLMELRNNLDMLFHFAGVQESDKVRTVGAAEAIARLRRLGIILPDLQLDALIELRNGVAHSTGSELALGLLPAFVKTIDSLLACADYDPTDFWGRWTDTVRLVVDEVQNDVDRRVQVRIQQARHAFADRFSGLSASNLESLRAPQAGSVQYVVQSFEGTLTVEGNIDCPACEGLLARITFKAQELGTLKSALTIGRLNCNLCGLHLAGIEELRAASVDIDGLLSEVDSFPFRMGSARDGIERPRPMMVDIYDQPTLFR